MNSHADRREQADTTFRVGAVLAALDQAGIRVARETVNRVSDTVLQLDTRSSGKFDRRWSKVDIDQLVVAFRIREARGLTWEGVAAAMKEGPAVKQLIDEELHDIRNQFAELAARCTDLVALADQLAQNPQLTRAA